MDKAVGPGGLVIGHLGEAKILTGRFLQVATRRLEHSMSDKLDSEVLSAALLTAHAFRHFANDEMSRMQISQGTQTYRIFAHCASWKNHKLDDQALTSSARYA